MENERVDARAVLSLVFGIIGIILSFFNSGVQAIGFLFVIPGLILGICVFKKKRPQKGLHTAGIIVSSIGLGFVVLSLMFNCMCALCMSVIEDDAVYEENVTSADEKEDATANSCDHSWIDATCEKPKQCEFCGLTEGKKLNHEEEWIVEVPATIEQKGIRVDICKNCGKELDRENYQLSEKEFENAYKELCKEIDYKKLARNPEKVKGEYIVIEGRVVEARKTGDSYDIRIDITYDEKLDWYEDTVYVSYKAEKDEDKILEDDILRIYGKADGEMSYISILGAKITLPSIKAEFIENKTND